jgi:hypothetical protein
VLRADNRLICTFSRQSISSPCALQIWAITRTVARVTGGADTGHNCTNYAAYVETLNGLARPSYQLGDARQLMLPGALSGVSAAGRR